MSGDDRTPDQLERDAELGRRLQAELPRSRRPARAPKTVRAPRTARTMDEPVIFREGGCLDSGCLPLSILLPAIALEFTARAVRIAILAVRRTVRDARDRRRAAAGLPPAPTTSVATAIGPPVRPPARWADAQRAFRTTYLSNPASLPRRQVTVTVTIDGSVTVSDPSGTVASMAFTPTREPGAPSWEGTEDGTLVGEHGTNAAACVEVAGGVVWPAYNPVGRASPGRA